MIETRYFTVPKGRRTSKTDAFNLIFILAFKNKNIIYYFFYYSHCYMTTLKNILAAIQKIPRTVFVTGSLITVFVSTVFFFQLLASNERFTKRVPVEVFTGVKSVMIGRGFELALKETGAGVKANPAAAAALSVGSLAWATVLSKSSSE